MSSQMNTKVRLVRCPKCQLVLPELAEVPVYKCGGCGTILQAKNRKRAPIKNNGLDQKEISSSSEEASPPSNGDASLNELKQSDQGGAEDCNKDLPRQINFPDELPGSSGLTCLENEDPLSKSEEHKRDEHSCALDEKTERYEHQKEFSGGENFSNRLSSSDQLTCHESGSSVIGAKEDAEVSANEEREQLELEKDTGCPTLETKQDAKGLALEAVEQLELDEHNFLVDHCTINDQNESGVNQKRFNSLSSTYFECINHRDELARDGIEKQLSVGSDMYQSVLNESIITDTLMSTDREQFEQFQKEIPSGFDRISSMDTLENSEPPVNLRNMIKSPTHRSYYAYDGSASSCDGDDHLPNQFHQQPERRFSSSEFHLDTRCRVNNTMSSESKIVQNAMNFSTALPGRRHHATEGSNWSHDKWLPSRKYGQASGSRMTLDKDEQTTTFPFISGSHTGHKHGNPSNYRNSVAHNSSLHPSRIPSNSEPDKIELLRMVYELEHQLRQTRITKSMANRRFSAEVMRDEEYTPIYYDQFLADGEVSADLNYSRYHVRCSHGKGWTQQRKSSRIPFSAEAAHYRHQADCLYLHGSPQVRHSSEQLHPSVCYNKGRRVAYSSCNCCNHLQSGSSSPQRYSSSEYSRWDQETKSDDRRHKDHEMKKLYLREKYSKMRHVRPVAGGAPIIACYYCSELLQLPADFLFSKRRCHQLRCNSCRKVLKFSLQNQTHVVPFYAEALAPPPSEVDDNTDAIDQQNLASAYHLNSCPHTDPISCSDDLGPSFCRSCSTEGESSLPPIQPLVRKSFNREISASSSDRKMKSVLREPHRESPGRSAKMSKWGKGISEIEEVQPSGGSPLHRLMGYSSPSEVIHW
uniref:Protein ENHANCED DISEASE RESISTANCE 4-like n=1 Tax=Nicotiana tabacum TaxID=4097 RepID=A0A1S3X5M4_TOBAC|nr:PREDICTED: uncharacterized protein LOC107761568 [Nicotiana tabacum]